ncbi:MAG: MFS transporter [Coleofasciculus sp. D1-CHI-01]|uniref:MFS transporter n=1 Tax=Coleofasciculus sp. D1-CHI-01 TaxID=3068482 RepID=UPI0032FD9F45
MKQRQKWVWGALFLCVFLAIFNEVLLSPFYPQFFRKVFGVEDLSYTGYYIFACRLTVVLCAPIWGILARRFEVKYLLFVGQIATAVMTALMATATNHQQFLVYTIVLLLFKSSYLLVYPLIIQLAGEAQRPTVAGTYQAVFHGAIVSATITGAWMVNFESPLLLFYWIALADVFQLGLCLYVLRGVSTRRVELAVEEDKGDKEDEKRSEGLDRAGFVQRLTSIGKRKSLNPPLQTHKRTSQNHALEGREGSKLNTSPIKGDNWTFLITIGVVILSFHLANNLVRPYFTAYVTAATPFNTSLLTSSVLFLIPSLMAIVALPYIRQACQPERLNTIYPWGIGLIMVSLYLQGQTQNLTILVLARMVYGFCFAVTQAALELKLFGKSRDNRLHFNYSLATSFANVGHLAAPLMASWLVSTQSLVAPFLTAAAICGFNSIFARCAVFRSFKSEQRMGEMGS